MAVFTYVPSFSAELEEKPTIRTVRFGDGYEQRLAFGLHTQPKKWALQFLNRTDAERTTILTFLRTAGGVTSFDWTDPTSYVGKWICEGWNTNLLNCNNNTITATFREVFEP